MNFENEFFLLFNYIFTKYLLRFSTEVGKGQYMYLETKLLNSSQDRKTNSFVFWENLRLNNFVSRSTDL